MPIVINNNMGNKRVSQFTVVNSLSTDDIFLINQNNITSTVRLSTLKNEIANNSQFSLGSAKDGQYPRYDANDKKWKPADFPTLGSSSPTTIYSVKEPAKGLARMAESHYGYAFFTDYGVYKMGEIRFVGGNNNPTYYNKPSLIPFLDNYLKSKPTVKPIKCTFNLRSVFVLLSDGTLWGVGYANYWQNGQPVAEGKTSSVLLPLNIGLLSNKFITDFSVNDSGDALDRHTLGVICSDNTAYVWGYNEWGQLGTGNTTRSVTPLQINVAGKTPAQISVGGYWSGAGTNVLVRMTDGTLYVAGWNGNGALGTGDTTTKNTFVVAKENSTTNVSNVAEILEFHVANMGYTRFIKKTDGTLWGTGLNDRGQLGIGNTTQQTYYTKSILPLGVSVKKLTSSGWKENTSMCLLDTNGLVYTWGNSSYGTTGQGSATHLSTPTRVQAFQKTMTSTDSLPKIKDVFGSGCLNNGSFGLISESGELYTAGLHSLNALTLMKTNSDHSDSYYRFEKRNDVENVEEVIFYDNSLINGGNMTVGTITRDIYGRLRGWGHNGRNILGSTERDGWTDTATQLNF